MSRTFALIPAAGKSTRMGQPKLLLPYGERTILESCVDAVTRGGADAVLVVVAPTSLELAALAQSAGAQVLVLPEETPDMRATVVHGLEWLESSYQPEPGDPWLLVPADHPTLDWTVARDLFEMSRRQPDRSIVVPAFEGRRGHPVLLSWKHVAGIRAMSPDEGLNSFVRRHADQVLEMPVRSAAILEDLDTPEDYARLRERLT
jgi:molybdenum cofactor cytidylyltransferase